jgi:hypothetical protein
MLPFGVTMPATVPQGAEIPEGFMNHHVLWKNHQASKHILEAPIRITLFPYYCILICLISFISLYSIYYSTLLFSSFPLWHASEISLSFDIRFSWEFQVIKSGRMGWTENAVLMGEWRDACRFFVRKSEGKSPLGRHRRRWRITIKMCFNNFGSMGVDWIDLAHDKDTGLVAVNAVIELRVW